MTSSDSRYSSHIAYSLLTEGNTDLDEFNLPANDPRLITVNGHRYSYFPMWSALLLIPVVALADNIYEPFFNSLPGLESKIRAVVGDKIALSKPIKAYELYPVTDKLASSLLCAISVGLFSLLAYDTLRGRYFYLTIIIFALGTSMWSTVSRAFWMHCPSVLMLVITLYFLLKGEQNSKYIAYVGATVALAFIFRPTNIVSVILITSYVALAYRQHLFYYLLAALPFALLYVGYNESVFGNVFGNYTRIDRLGIHGQFYEALLGNLVSPARGLFVYSPIFVFSCIGLWLNRSRLLVQLLMAVIICHWLLISTYSHWWAGHSYGPRFFSDMLPFLSYGLILFLHQVSQMSKKVKIFMYAAALCSVLINANGGLNKSAFMWNIIPVNIDDHPQRLWDWSDPQFARINNISI